jgi:hypothetical protein
MLVVPPKLNHPPSPLNDHQGGGVYLIVRMGGYGSQRQHPRTLDSKIELYYFSRLFNVWFAWS